MFGERVISMHPGLIKYFQEIEAADAARRAAASPAGQQAGSPEASPPAPRERRRYVTILPGEEDMDLDDFGV